MSFGDRDTEKSAPHRPPSSLPRQRTDRLNNRLEGFIRARLYLPFTPVIASPPFLFDIAITWKTFPPTNCVFRKLLNSPSPTRAHAMERKRGREQKKGVSDVKKWVRKVKEGACKPAAATLVCPGSH